MQGAQRIRVCFVEDEWAIAELLRMSADGEPDLETCGILPRADGLRAHIQQESPDVVVIDLTLPGVDPLIVVKEASAAGRPRFVVYSGYDDEETLDRVRAAGAFGFVSKRHDVDALLDCVRRVAAGERVENA